MAGRDPAALFHSLSDPSRLRLLRLLSRAELNVQELVAITGLSQPRVSRHLGVLRKQGWLRQRREGTWNWYRAVAPEEFPFGAPLVAQVAETADGVDGALPVPVLSREPRVDQIARIDPDRGGHLGAIELSSPSFRHRLGKDRSRMDRLRPSGKSVR